VHNAGVEAAAAGPASPRKITKKGKAVIRHIPPGAQTHVAGPALRTADCSTVGIAHCLELTSLAVGRKICRKFPLRCPPKLSLACAAGGANPARERLFPQ